MAPPTVPGPALSEADVVAHGTLVGAFRATVARVPDRVALRTVPGEPELTWRAFGDRVAAVAAGLAGLGLVHGDRVGIMTTNSVAFHLVDTAAMHLGVIPVSLYNSLPADDIAWILGDAGITVVVAEAPFLDQLVAARAAGAPLRCLVALADEPGVADTTLAAVEQHPPAGFDLDAAGRAVTPDHPATISYTSGTTGNPKGVVLSHGAILRSLDALDAVIGTVDGARVISFLPMAHLGGRIFAHYPVLAYGFTVSCCPDITQVGRYVHEVHPHYLCAPPRLFEKMRGALEARIERNEDGWGAEARAALELGLEKVDREQAGEEVPDDLLARWDEARTRLLLPLLAELGLDAVVASLFGSAAVPPHLVRFFLALGLPVLETWGMTECAAFGATNPPDDVRIGTVGLPFPGAEITLADDGEILFRSPWMMTGYLNRADLTAETIDAAGWLHTGDVGETTADGRLRIVDRKKELIISAFGKNMSPANIEFKLKAASPLIGQVCVVGDGRRFNSALVVLDPEVARTVAAPGTAVEDLAADAAVLDAIERAVTEANGRMARVEAVKKYRVLAEQWTPGDEVLSPTMKVRRRAVDRHYAALIEDMYA